MWRAMFSTSVQQSHTLGIERREITRSASPKATATRQSSSLPQKALFHHLSRVRKASTAPQCPRSGPDGFMG